jgi:hypothetical protein
MNRYKSQLQLNNIFNVNKLTKYNSTESINDKINDMVIRYSSTRYFILNNETNLELIDDPKTCDEIFEFDKMIYEQNVYNNKLFEKINEFWDDNKIMSVLSMINDYVNCNLTCIKNVIDKNINAIDDEIFDVLR